MAEKRVDVTPVSGLEIQVGLLLEMLDDNTRDWREELGEVTEDTLVWQPVTEGHSIGALLLHIADVEAYWLYEIATGTPRTGEELAALLSEETQQYDGKWPEPPRRPLSWYYEQHDAIRARTHQVVRQLNDPERIGKRREVEFTLRWLLHHVITHEAYHGGQAVLLALMYNKR
jgi:uncharacterized damage-inducible protein DinB